MCNFTILAFAALALKGKLFLAPKVLLVVLMALKWNMLVYSADELGLWIVSCSRDGAESAQMEKTMFVFRG